MPEFHEMLWREDQFALPSASQRGLRHDLEQFFTPFWAAEEIVRRKFPDLTANDFVVDAGAGTGAFLAAVPGHVPCLGVELDPELATSAHSFTGRDVLCGDFRTLDLPARPTVVLGNPPWSRNARQAFLRRAHELLPDNGRCGFILPASAFSFAGPVADWAEAWSMHQELLPRNLFPRVRHPFVFCMFIKERVRKMVGFFLFEEARDIAETHGKVRMVLLNGRKHRSTWRALIEDAIDAFGGRPTREQIRSYIAPRRLSANPFWKDRVRELLNSSAFGTDSQGRVIRAAA